MYMYIYVVWTFYNFCKETFCIIVFICVYCCFFPLSISCGLSLAYLGDQFSLVDQCHMIGLS